MREQVDTRSVCALAERQGGRVSRRQLVELGLSGSGVGRRVDAGLLAAEARGVYRVGPDVPTRTGRLWRALLACGPQAALSHASAAVEHGLLERWSGAVHVSVPSTSGREAPDGVVLHRRPKLRAEDVVEVDGLPVCSPALTLLDLAHRHPKLLPKALNAAQRLMLDVGDVRALARGRPGAAVLRAAVDAYHPLEQHTKEELERRALRMLVAAAIEPYEPNAALDTPLGLIYVDGLFREERIVVELQSEAHHATPAERRADRHRANAVQAAGHAFLQWDWEDVTRHHERTVTQLRPLLAPE